VLPTYKAKGVLPDSHPGTVGTFTGAAGESVSFDSADLIVLYGLDPVELIPQPWQYDAPILDIFPHSGSESPASPVARVIGPLAEVVRRVLPAAKRSVWTQDEIARLREGARARLHCSGDGHTTQSVVELAGQVAPPSCRATVDAGAHMFSVLSSWQADKAFGVLKSNGLSTMGYALPAAIASCLEEPDRPVVAFTGDGGLMMCLGELKTAVEHNCRIVVMVLNDSALSLIDIKQQRQQRASVGVRYPSTDFAGIAQALGCPSWHVDSHDDLTPAMTAAFAHAGPTLIDVTVDPSGYGDQLVALRG
jgi:acetolactate synthase-1/2/3 large subunit